VINYLRACPLPEAAAQLGELEKIDPAAFKRATSFFPVPQPASPTTKQSSSLVPVAPAGRLYASLPVDMPLAMGTPLAVSPALPAPNPMTVTSVIAMAAVTVMLAMWLAITGTGSRGIVAYAWACVASRNGF